MASDVEKLVVALEARTKAFENAMARAAGNTENSMRRVDRSVRDMANRVNQVGTTAFRGLMSSAAALGTALSVREVVGYAEAWTKVKNSLAVAGLTGERQAQTLQKLFQLSQDNAAPLEATVQLYGRASMAADNLGATQEELVRLTDAVGLALRVSGQDATQASGALLQLGQALQGNKIQAQEYNSLIDGMYPLLQAAAAGSQRWGGSVARLTADVKASKVSAQEFFRAILAGTEELRGRASNATQTISQSMTKVNNAFLKYIGSTDEGLGASQRLATGLNALADNFDSAADVAVQLATVLGAGLLGRSIGSMVAAIPVATSSVLALIAALRAGTLTAGGFAAALGPLGLIAGVAAGAAVAFGRWGDAVDDVTRSLADQAARGGAIEGIIDDTRKAQEAYKSAIAGTAAAQTGASNSIIADTKREFEAKKALLELELKRQRALLAVQSADLAAKGAALKAEVGSKVLTRDSSVSGGYSDPRIGDFVRKPDDITGLEKTREVLANSPITAEIERIRAEMALTEIGAKKLEEAFNSTFSSGGAVGGGVDPGGGGGSGEKGGGKSRADEFQRETQQIRERTAALEAAVAVQAGVSGSLFTLEGL
jgi:tape measure domain-containing protein